MEQWNYQQPPPPNINGGWYTGTVFPECAPWRNFSVTPDVSFMINHNLRSAGPPPGAIYQYPSAYRPGNNAPCMPGVVSLMSNPNLDMKCVAVSSRGLDATKLLPTPPPKFSRYAYV